MFNKKGAYSPFFLQKYYGSFFYLRVIFYTFCLNQDILTKHIHGFDVCFMLLFKLFLFLSFWSVKMDSQNDINLPLNEDGETQLMQAAQAGDTAKVGFLIENGADINLATSKDRRTALMFAAEYGHTETVILLVEKGANIHAVGKTLGNCPVNAHMLAAMSGNENTSNYINNSLLFEAALNGDSNSIRTYLSNDGADVNFTNVHGLTPLMVAAGYGHIQSVVLLIENGADVNITVKNSNMTARMIAEHKGYKNICDLIDLMTPANNNALIFSNHKRKATDDVEENENRPHKRARISGNNDENVESKVESNMPYCNIF